MEWDNQDLIKEKLSYFPKKYKLYPVRKKLLPPLSNGVYFDKTHLFNYRKKN